MGVDADGKRQIADAYVDDLTQATLTVREWEEKYNASLPDGQPKIDLEVAVDRGYNTGQGVGKGTLGAPE